MQLAKLKNETQLARPIKVLVPLIREEVTRAGQAGVPHYAAAGEMLWEAKTSFSSPLEFYRWATSSFACSRTTIKNWMNYAIEMNGGQPFDFQEDIKSQRADRPQPAEFPTLSEVTEPKRHPRHAPDWYQPVQEVANRINVDRIREDAENKAKEAKLQRELGLQLIDIGYRVLAAKLHPDKGGSARVMTRLNQVRNLLKGALR